MATSAVALSHKMMSARCRAQLGELPMRIRVPWGAAKYMMLALRDMVVTRRLGTETSVVTNTLASSVIRQQRAAGLPTAEDAVRRHGEFLEGHAVHDRESRRFRCRRDRNSGP